MTIVYFATNRAPNRMEAPDNFTENFSSFGLANLRFGQASVECNNKTQTRCIRNLEIYSENNSGTILGSKRLFEHLADNLKNNDSWGDLLIYIHGYNESFEEAITKGAELVELYSKKGNAELKVIVFTWPSDGKLTHYQSDRHDAEVSAFAFARGFDKLSHFLRRLNRENRCNKKIHLLAHSIGVYLLRCALRYTTYHNAGRLPRVFEHILLSSSDEDSDAFSDDSKLKRLTELSRCITVYFNQNDIGLAGSEWQKGNPERLGSDGADAPLSLPSKVIQVNCTPTVEGIVEHDYFSSDKMVIDDISRVLNSAGKQELDGRTYNSRLNTWNLCR